MSTLAAKTPAKLLPRVPAWLAALLDGNARKNDKHGVSMAEAEQVFFNAPLLLLEDGVHSVQERRLHALGKTGDARLLHISFTLRRAGALIRVISARDMHRKEKSVYEQAD